MFKKTKPGKKGGRPTIILEEHQIRWAMDFSNSNGTAAKMLGVAYETYRKWAKTFIDKETNKSLFDMHYPGYTGRGLGHSKYAIPLDEILANKHVNYPDYRLKRRLIDEGLKKPECTQCGFDEERITDKKVPILLDFIDGNPDDKSFDNLQFLCLNCFFLISRTPNNIIKADFE